jgi:membrane-associated protease RseP (regulator of RpoE activity)
LDFLSPQRGGNAVKNLLWIIAVFGLMGWQGQTRAEEKNATHGAHLGVVVEKVPDAVRSQLPNQLADGQGILIVNVAKDSPAGKAGIQANDILLTFGDQKLTSADQLVKLVRSRSPGQTVEMTYLRAGKTSSCKATLGENPTPASVERPMPPSNPNVFRFFPDDHFLKLFEQNEVMNGDKNWASFDAMKLTRTDANHWTAEIEFRANDGKKESKKFTGTRQEIRKQIQEEKDLPANERNHLLRSMNLQPPVFEFEFPIPGAVPPTSGQRP